MTSTEEALDKLAELAAADDPSVQPPTIQLATFGQTTRLVFSDRAKRWLEEHGTFTHGRYSISIGGTGKMEDNCIFVNPADLTTWIGSYFNNDETDALLTAFAGAVSGKQGQMEVLSLKDE